MFRPAGAVTPTGQELGRHVAMPRKRVPQSRDKSVLMTTTAAAYARFSSDRQREESIEIQLEAIRKYCESHDLTLGPVYKDLAMSGTNDRRTPHQRPAFVYLTTL